MPDVDPTQLNENQYRKRLIAQYLIHYRNAAVCFPWVYYQIRRITRHDHTLLPYIVAALNPETTYSDKFCLSYPSEYGTYREKAESTRDLLDIELLRWVRRWGGPEHASEVARVLAGNCTMVQRSNKLRPDEVQIAACLALGDICNDPKCSALVQAATDQARSQSVQAAARDALEKIAQRCGAASAVMA